MNLEKLTDKELEDLRIQKKQAILNFPNSEKLYEEYGKITNEIKRRSEAIKDPKMQTKVVHSQSNPAWNVVGERLGGKYKIARCPYVIVDGSEELTNRERQEAFEHATFISYCFNNSEDILKR